MVPIGLRPRRLERCTKQKSRCWRQEESPGVSCWLVVGLAPMSGATTGPRSVGMGGDLLASTGETASCGTTTINVPDAGWCRQRERPGLASPRLRGAAWRADFQSLPPGRHQAACPCPGTAGTPGTGPGCPRRVREAGSGGDCRLQRRMTTPAGRRARVYSAFSAARRRMCRAAAQECPPRISGVSGHRTRKISCFWRHRRCIAAADGVVAWQQFLRQCGRTVAYGRCSETAGDAWSNTSSLRGFPWRGTCGGAWQRSSLHTTGSRIL